MITKGKHLMRGHILRDHADDRCRSPYGATKRQNRWPEGSA
jgi:hypothetical protein